jgi:hypothetical protein
MKYYDSSHESLPPQPQFGSGVVLTLLLRKQPIWAVGFSCWCHRLLAQRGYVLSITAALH